MQLTKVNNFDTATELWKLEGIVGSSGGRELFLSQNGSNGTNPSTADWAWVSGQAYQWRLMWDGDIARFTLFSGAIDASSSATLTYDVVNTLINGLQLSTKVDTRDSTKVGLGTAVNLTLATLNGQTLDTAFGASVTAVGSNPAVIGNNLFLAFSEQVTTLNATGTVTFNWGSFNPQSVGAGSRVSFQLEANSLPITNSNSAPIATNDTASTSEDGAIAIPVLANDSDPDPGDSLSINAIDSTGLQGTVSIQGDSVLYSPGSAFQALSAGQSTTEQLTYTVIDSQGATDVATVVVTIQGANDIPFVTGNIGDRAITAGTPLSIGLMPTLFTDVDQGDTLTWNATLENGNSLPDWLQFDATTRSLTGTPTNADAGTLAIRVTATDTSGALAQTGFQLTVNAANSLPGGGSTPSPSPVPVPSPSPNPSPVPVPSPSPNPSPVPVPSPLPNPSPTPLPTPSIIRGTARSDRLLGTGLDDTILGLARNDRLLGRAGNDVLQGGRGNDTLQGEAGLDRLVGGAGRDIFVLKANTGMDIIQDFRNGQDRLRLLGGLRFQNLILQRQGQNLMIKTRQETLAILQGISPAQITLADIV